MRDEFGVAVWFHHNRNMDGKVRYRSMTQDQADGLIALLSLLRSFDIIHDFDIWVTN